MDKETKRQKRITVNFRDNNDVDDDLHKWIIKKGSVIGVSNAIKQILAEAKEREEGK